jgi:hypothetical protein
MDDELPQRGVSAGKRLADVSRENPGQVGGACLSRLQRFTRN